MHQINVAVEPNPNEQAIFKHFQTFAEGQCAKNCMGESKL